MKTKLSVAILAMLTCTAAAEPNLYGKANVSLHNADVDDESSTELVSNASRMGLKAAITVDDSMEAIYQFEFQTHVDDGDSGDRTITQRNIFVGLKGNFGTVKAGKFDSPLKESQNKIDLFNDLVGDMANLITFSDNRPNNIVSYTSPENPIVAKVAVIASEDEAVDDGASLSVAYDQNDIYVSLAYDTNVEAESLDVIRAVGQYTLNDFQFGAMYEEADADGESADGWLLSGQYTMDKWALKAQFGQSDLINEAGESLSLGVDYKLSKPVKLFGYYTNHESDAGVDNNYLGIGIEVKFDSKS